MPRRYAVLALAVAVCWAVNFVVIDVGLESFPPLLFAALRFGLTAFPAIFVVPRPDQRWPTVVGVGLLICVGQFGLLFVAMNIGLPHGSCGASTRRGASCSGPLIALIGLGLAPGVVDALAVPRRTTRVKRDGPDRVTVQRTANEPERRTDAPRQPEKSP